MIKIYTEQKHRFNRKINIAGIDVLVDSKGNAEVPENIAAKALIAGFELVDKNAVYETEEEQKKAAEVSSILAQAKAQAAEIIAQANKQAEGIIAAAKKQAETINEENHVDEKDAKKAELSAMSVSALKDLLKEAQVPEEEFKSMKKAELVDKIMSIIFAE